MNEQTQQLIKQLADKLGTTTEHLWAALLRQAPISATCTIICFVIMLIVAWLLFKTGIKLGKMKEDRWDIDKEVCQAIVWTLAGCLVAVTCVVFCFQLDMVMAGFFNPEYWALKEILPHH